MTHMTGRLEEFATAPPTVGERLDKLLARIGAKGVFSRDAALAVAVAVISLALFSMLGPLALRDPSLEMTAGQVRLVTAMECVQALLLCLRRVRPGLCLAAIVALQIPVIAIAPDVMAHGLGPVFAAYTFATVRSVRAIAAAVAAAALAEAATVIAVASGEDDALVTIANQVSAALLTYTVVAFVGVYVATRRRNIAFERERAAEAIQARIARAEAAVAAERTRIARELHDVAAHHLSGMVIQAAAVERLIGRDADAAKSGAAWIRSQGKATLENLRQVVGLLREHGADGDGNAPIPGVSALPALVDEARQLGSEVEFERSGRPLRLPPIADIALYRIAQQSLTNARQHAPGARVRIRLAYGDDDVALEVANGPSVHDEIDEIGNGGTGLVGMRERAALVGGDLTAGPSADGGWRVGLELPVRDAERRAEDIEFETGDRT